MHFAGGANSGETETVKDVQLMTSTIQDILFFKKRQKNFIGIFFITGADLKKKTFSAGLIRNNDAITVGAFSQGMTAEEKTALLETLKKTSDPGDNMFLAVEPGICVELEFSSIKNGKLVKPVFLQFQFKYNWKDCTLANLMLRNSAVDDGVNITNPDKIIWDEPPVSKDEYIAYLFEAAPHILPFLENRTVTVIRYPDGIKKEAFYQKNRPDYTPDFIHSYFYEDINYIVCDNLSSLLWLGNQAALELHVPFNFIGENNPSEIVFDLDPPGKDYFPLAIKAAREMKKLFDKFAVKSFPKLSGGKGLQIHIPVAGSPYTYEETRLFTEFIAKYLTELFPDDFTVERMKKKRGNKLYIDYVQHWRGKTIIAPYSSRGRKGATVAAPLHWEEINDELLPENYSVFTVRERLKKQPCPFKKYFGEENTALKAVIDSLKKQSP